MNLISLPSRFHHISYIYIQLIAQNTRFFWWLTGLANSRLLRDWTAHWREDVADEYYTSQHSCATLRPFKKKKHMFLLVNYFCAGWFRKKKKHVQSTQNHQPLGGVCFCFFKTPRSFTVFLIVAAESLSGLLKGSSLLSIKKRITPAENSVGSENCRP